MPRYRGTPRRFAKTIKLQLEKSDLERADAISMAFAIPRSEAIRRAINNEYVSLVSSGAIKLIVQPVVQTGAQGGE